MMAVAVSDDEVRKLHADVDRLRSDLAMMVEDLTELRQDIRDSVREGHELLSDLKRERQACESMIARGISRDIEQKMLQEVQQGMATYREKLMKAIEDGTQAAYDRFDAIVAICLGEDAVSQREGKGSIPDMIRLIKQYLSSKGLPWQVVPSAAVNQAKMEISQGMPATVPDAFVSVKTRIKAREAR